MGERGLLEEPTGNQRHHVLRGGEGTRAAAIKAASAASAVKARVPGTRSYFQELGAEQVLVNDVAVCEEQDVTGCISPGSTLTSR